MPNIRVGSGNASTGRRISPSTQIGVEFRVLVKEKFLVKDERKDPPVCLENTRSEGVIPIFCLDV